MQPHMQPLVQPRPVKIIKVVGTNWAHCSEVSNGVGTKLPMYVHQRYSSQAVNA